MKRLLYWSPRILAIGFAFFLALFALDVFTEGYGFWEALLALFIHLMPTWLILVALITAWYWERLGGSLFILMGFSFVFISRGDLIAALIIAAPAIVIGTLFLIDSIFRARLKVHSNL